MNKITSKAFNYALCIMNCALMAACSSDDDLYSAYLSDPNAVHVNATIGAPSLTRVNTDGDGGSWESGDKIYVINTSCNISGKKEAVFYNGGGSNWSIYTGDTNGITYTVWVDGTNNFEAYSPYLPGAYSTSSFSKFTLPSEQGTAQGLKEADWMVAEASGTKEAAKAVATKTIDLAFAHQLAKVTIVISGKGNQYSSPTLSNAKITVPTTKTKIEYKTVDENNSETTKERTVTFSGTTITPYESTADGKTTYTAILMPGSYAKGETFLTLTVNDTDKLTVKVPDNSIFTSGFESGKSYKLELTVGKNAITIGDVKVENWGDGGSKTGGNADETTTD